MPRIKLNFDFLWLLILTFSIIIIIYLYVSSTVSFSPIRGALFYFLRARAGAHDQDTTIRGHLKIYPTRAETLTKFIWMSDVDVPISIYIYIHTGGGLRRRECRRVFVELLFTLYSTLFYLLLSRVLFYSLYILVYLHY